MKSIGFSGKGWHNQSLRHSQARKFGKAGGISKTSNKKRLRKKSTYSLLKEPYKELHNSPNKDEYGRDAETPEQRKKAIEESKRLNEEIEESKGVNESKNVMKDKNFTDDKGLNYSVSIVVPSTQDVDEGISEEEFNKRKKRVKKKLNSIYGGSTSVKAVGSYTDKKNNLVNEKVFIVTAHADKDSFVKGKKPLNKYVNSVKNKWGQESIGVSVETPDAPSKTLYFV